MTIATLWGILLDQGVTVQEIEMIKHIYLVLLLLPIVVTIIGIARYIIGLRSLSVYIPIVLTFVFFELAYNDGKTDLLFGLKYGIPLFLFTLLFSILVYSLFKKFRMHYIPKLSLVVTGVSIMIMPLILVSAYFGIKRLIYVAPFLFIMLMTTSEGFMAVLAKKNIRYTFSISMETLIIILISFLVITWSDLQTYLIRYPFSILIILLINLLVGRFLGLRLNEYWRFRSLLFNTNLGSNNNDKSKPTTAKQEVSAGEKRETA